MTPARALRAASLATALATCPAAAEESSGAPEPWSLEAQFGALNDSHWSETVFLPHQTSLTGDGLAGVGVARRVADLGAGLSLEVGFLFNYRSEERGLEFALPVALAFDRFPWRDRLPTRLRLAFGPSFTTRIGDVERRRDDGDGSRILSMFNPEIAFGAPNAPEWSVFFRLHHRSGAFGLIDGIQDGSTY